MHTFAQGLSILFRRTVIKKISTEVHNIYYALQICFFALVFISPHFDYKLQYISLGFSVLHQLEVLYNVEIK